jgi:hypothetical protein
MPHRDREDRILDLVEELNDHPTDDFVSGKMVKAWAAKPIEYEEEERIAVVAFLKHANAPKVIIDMIERGAHRGRSTNVMKELKAVGPQLARDRLKIVDKLVREYVTPLDVQQPDRELACESAGGGRRR